MIPVQRTTCYNNKHLKTIEYKSLHLLGHKIKNIWGHLPPCFILVVWFRFFKGLNCCYLLCFFERNSTRVLVPIMSTFSMFQSELLWIKMRIAIQTFLLSFSLTMSSGLLSLLYSNLSSIGNSLIFYLYSFSAIY